MFVVVILIVQSSVVVVSFIIHDMLNTHMDFNKIGNNKISIYCSQWNAYWMRVCFKGSHGRMRYSSGLKNQLLFHWFMPHWFGVRFSERADNWRVITLLIDLRFKLCKLVNYHTNDKYKMLFSCYPYQYKPAV